MKNTKLSKTKTILILIGLFILLTSSFLLIIRDYSSYVAKVDGERITVYEYKFFLNSVKHEMEEMAAVGFDPAARKAFWESKFAGKDPKEQAQEIALQRLRELKIELIQAKAQGITLSQEEKDEIENALNQKVGEFGTQKAAEAYFLNEYGVTMQEYQKIIGELRIVYNFMKIEQAKINISEEAAQYYYSANRNKVDAVTVVHILFSTQDQESGKPFSDEKQAQAKSKAEEILSKVRSGEDIKALAKKFSEDPGLAQNEGVYTVTHTGPNSNYVKEFKEWALTHFPGDSNVVKTDFGYHVMKVMDRTDYVKSKDAAIEGARNEKFQEMVEEWKKMPRFDLVMNQLVLSQIK